MRAALYIAGLGNPLLPDGPIPVLAASLEEAVTHHAMAEPKEQNCQHDRKQELPKAERG
jgi:hypothetical protein